MPANTNSSPPLQTAPFPNISTLRLNFIANCVHYRSLRIKNSTSGTRNGCRLMCNFSELHKSEYYDHKNPFRMILVVMYLPSWRRRAKDVSTIIRSEDFLKFSGTSSGKKDPLIASLFIFISRINFTSPWYPFSHKTAHIEEYLSASWPLSIRASFTSVLRSIWQLVPIAMEIFFVRHRVCVVGIIPTRQINSKRPPPSFTNIAYVFHNKRFSHPPSN